jgi:tetratricopeptide (TPR) repeat protein
VPIDREATLKKAEKLLRQGKLDGAIAEYVRLTEENPKDWNSINALGDLYVRGGQVDNGVAQFLRVADYLYEEGFHPKAAALYKKVLRLKSDDEHTLLRLADISARQGVFVDAKTYYRHVADRRLKKGDEFGHAQIVIALGELDPNDAEAKIQAARAAHRINDSARAVALLTAAADVLDKQQRMADALAALSEAATYAPDDVALRTRLVDGFIAQGQGGDARKFARTSEELVRIADTLQHEGKNAEAVDVLAQALQLDPANSALRSRLAKEAVASGKIENARAFLSAESAGDDPDLLMALARMELESGRIDEGKSALNRLLALRPDRREGLVFVASEFADEGRVDAAYACVEIVADAALLEQDWGGAASALHEFVTRVPNQIPALMKLVEICVDGGLESTMYMAQAQLADAYLAVGQPAEARVIAEDLVAREPWVRANIERFRRALTMLGVPDPDAVIAERLSGESPFLSTIDLGPISEEPADVGPSPTPREMPQPPGPSAAPPPEPPPLADVGAELPEVPGGLPELPDLAALPDLPDLPDLPELSPVPERSELTSHDEIDLSDALSGMKKAPPPPLENVFQGMRSKAMRDSEVQNAQAEYTAGLEHANGGRRNEAITAFEHAARVPMLRWQAGTRAGRMYIEQGDLQRGVEWLERATQAPPPTEDEGYAVMYELADALERLGESARALAVFMELQADAGDYRDLAARIDRLSRVQTR